MNHVTFYSGENGLNRPISNDVSKIQKISHTRSLEDMQCGFQLTDAMYFCQKGMEVGLQQLSPKSYGVHLLTDKLFIPFDYANAMYYSKECQISFPGIEFVLWENFIL